MLQVSLGPGRGPKALWTIQTRTDTSTQMRLLLRPLPLVMKGSLKHGVDSSFLVVKASVS